MAKEFVTMHHSETGGEAKATQEAFDEVWEPKGWKLGEAPDKKRKTSTTKKEGEA